MRHALLTALLIAFTGSSRADDAEATALVDRAIQAIGGTKKLSTLKGGTWKTSGTVRGKPSRAEFHGELPGKFRLDSTRKVDGKPVRHSRIINGDKGWVVEGDKVRPMTAAELAGVHSSFYFKQLATTLLPLKHKDCKLTALGPAEINGKPTMAVKASRPGFPDVMIYFDQETGLPAKTEMTATNRVTGKDRKVELLFDNYKEFDGVKMAGRTRTYHDGKLFLDTELLEFHQAKSLPAKLFTAP